MKCLYWNVRGFANQPTKLAVKRLILKHKHDLCFLGEPWMALDKISPAFFSRLNLRIFTMSQRNGLLPNLWYLYASQLDPQIILQDDQHVSFVINDGPYNFGMVVTYASTSYIKRREL
ncbi:unnamed protein product [Lathyrus sativus]|nr:unnamed protein product [Lathyrus sativus]